MEPKKLEDVIRKRRINYSGHIFRMNDDIDWSKKFSTSFTNRRVKGLDKLKDIIKDLKNINSKEIILTEPNLEKLSGNLKVFGWAQNQEGQHYAHRK